jgi:hypothetical protein
MEVKRSIQDSEESLPDGTWRKRKVDRTVVKLLTLLPETEPYKERFPGEQQEKVDVQEFETVRDEDKYTIKTKVTTKELFLPVLLRTKPEKEGEEPKEENIEEPIGVEILEEITELPPGVQEPGPGMEVKRSIQDSEQTLPDGTWRKCKVDRTVVNLLAPLTAKEIPKERFPGEPQEKIDIQEFESTREEDQYTIRTRITTTEHFRQVVERTIPLNDEKPVEEVVTEPVGVDIVEEITELPPGIQEPGPGMEVKHSIQDSHQTLPDGTWMKKKIDRTVVSLISSVSKEEMPKEQVLGDAQQKTDVQQFETIRKEDNYTIKTTINTISHFYPVMKLTTPKDGGEPRKEVVEEPIGIEIIEEILELPPGIKEPGPNMAVKRSVQESEEKLPDGIWKRRKVDRTTVEMVGDGQIPGDFASVIAQVEGGTIKKVRVEEYDDSRDDGYTIHTKATITEHFKPVVDIVILNEVESKSVREVFLGTEVVEDIVEMPPGVSDIGPNMETKKFVQDSEQCLPNGTWQKKTVNRTVVRVLGSDEVQSPLSVKAAPGSEIPVVSMEEGLPTSSDLLPGVIPEGAVVQESEEVLPNGTVVKKRVVTFKTETTVVRKVITEMPSGEIKQEIFTEEISGPELLQPKDVVPVPVDEDLIEPEEKEHVQLAAPVRREIIEDDIIPSEEIPAEKMPDRLPVDETEIVPEDQPQPEPMKRPEDLDGPQVLVAPPDDQLFEPVRAPTDEYEEIEETLPDGTLVKRKIIKTKVKKIVTKKIRRVGPDGEVIEDVITEEVPESELSETSSLRSSLSEAHEVISPVPSLSSPAELASPAESIEGDRAAVRVYTDTIEGEPQVETDVKEFEETLPDGTIIKRRVVKTRQKQTIVKRVVMEGPETDLPTSEEQAQLMIDQGTVYEPEMKMYSDKYETEPEESTDVQEYEETLPDGSVVKKKVVTTTEQQMKTERTLMEGTGHVPGLTEAAEAELFPDEEPLVEGAPPSDRTPVEVDAIKPEAAFGPQGAPIDLETSPEPEWHETVEQAAAPSDDSKDQPPTVTIPDEHIPLEES